MMKTPLTLAGLFLIACTAENTVNETAAVDSVPLVDTLSVEVEKPHRRVFPSALDSGKIWTDEGVTYLFGGEDPKQHFDITDCSLNPEQFHFGIGREVFPALLEPAFISVNEASQDTSIKDDSRFLLLQMGSTTKAYSVRDLTNHEVVNDVVEGRPIMAAYCILADLGAIYDREVNGKIFTFGLSGTTYADEDVWEGLDGFVMWDRETESLWWPLIGKAVSGPMKESKMKVLDEEFWSQTTWAEIKTKYADAQVLESGQDFERPDAWPKYTDVNISEEVSGASVAPHWGENESISPAGK